MQRVHPIAALVTAASIFLTAEWFIRREESLLAKFFGSLGY